MIDRLSQYGIWVARLMVAAIFLLNAIGVVDQSRPAHEMIERGIPAAIVPFLMWCGRGLELVAGLALLLGFWQRLAALALIAFLVPATLIAHPFWLFAGEAGQVQLINFLKNLAMVGGLLFIASTPTRGSAGRGPVPS